MLSTHRETAYLRKRKLAHSTTRLTSTCQTTHREPRKWQKPRGQYARITEIIREGAAAKTLLGASPMDTLQARRITPFLAPGWTVKNGTVTAIIFSVTAQGQFRYKLGTDAIKNAVLLGDIIRLRNYAATAEDVDLYIGDNGNYTDILKRYVLRKP